MTQPAEHEPLGDIEAPFELTKAHHRRQETAARLADSMRCDVPRLTYEQFRSGVPCPGCGRPYVDAEPWESRGTMHMTEDERARYEAEELTYKELHASCHSARHSMSGSLTIHCMKCCPPPPMSPTQVEKVRAIPSRPAPPTELMVWRLRLYCGHVIDRRAHRSHLTADRAFTGGLACTECSLRPATIIDAVPIGPVENARATISPNRAANPRITRAQLK